MGCGGNAACPVEAGGVEAGTGGMADRPHAAEEGRAGRAASVLTEGAGGVASGPISRESAGAGGIAWIVALPVPVLDED